LKHPHVPLPQIAGELGLVDPFPIVEGLPEEGIGIQPGDHVAEGIRLLEGHTEQGKDLRAGVVVFLVFIGLEHFNRTIQEGKAKLPKEVHTGKSFKKEGFISGETSSC
jgi:hypothetical protein